MPIAFYMDQHVPRAITVGLRLRGVEVLTAYEDGTNELAESLLVGDLSEVRFNPLRIRANVASADA